MSSIVKGDSEIKRNDNEKQSASDEKTQNSEKRNRKKSKNKSKTKKSEPEIISDDSEPGPSKSSSADLEPGPSGLSGLKQTGRSEKTALAKTDGKKSEKPLDKNITGPIQTESSREEIDSKKSKRGPSIKLFGDEVCSICGRKADGFHYNVLSCQGCKGFFRRTILQNAEYVCRTGKGGCDLKMVDHARQRCQKCRIERCYEAGMLEKYVRRKKNRTRTMRILENMKRPTVIVESLTDDQNKLIGDALKAWKYITDAKSQSKLMEPKFKEMKQKAQEANLNGVESQHIQVQAMLHIKIKLIVEFCMTLAPFRRFSLEDQQEILTKVLIEMMILHTTAKYDITTRSIPTYDGSKINKSRFIQFGAPEDIANEVFDLFHSVGRLKLSNETTGILCCLVIFSPDRNFSKSLDKELTNVQSEYVSLLSRHVQRKHSFHRNYTGRLLGLLPKLRFFAESTVMQNKKFAYALTQMAPSVARTMLQDRNQESLVEKLAEKIPPCEDAGQS